MGRSLMPSSTRCGSVTPVSHRPSRLPGERQCRRAWRTCRPSTDSGRSVCFDGEVTCPSWLPRVLAFLTAGTRGREALMRDMVRRYPLPVLAALGLGAGLVARFVGG